MRADREGRLPRPLAIALPSVLCLLLLAQATYFHERKSITYDETFYLAAALQSVHDGRFDSRLATWGVAPLPIVLDYLAPALAAGGEARRDLWKGRPEDRAGVGRARRIHAVVAGCGLILGSYFWLLVRRGWKAAAIAAALLAFSPTLVAHASVATTDAIVALLVLLALAALGRLERKPSVARVFVAALAIAGAISAKYSALFLLPVAALWMSVPALPDVRAFARGALRFALLAALVGPLVWAFHGFESSEPLTPRTPRAERDPSARWPTPLVGIRSQLDHQAKGHPGFLDGERSNRGWLAYYPTAFAAKSTPAELLLFASGIALAVSGMTRRKVRAEAPADPATRRLWALAIVVYAALAVVSPVAIGQRHLLVLYPLLVLWSVDALWEHGGRPRGLQWGLGALVVLQLVSAVRIAPHYLSYFNFTSGGPSRAYELLVDSNLDWGQDLILLGEQLDALGSRCAIVDYFGTADPAGYELPVTKLSWSSPAALADCDHLAVSATKLQEVYARKPAYAELRERVPDARAGFSIFIYALADLPEELKAGLFGDG